MENSYIDIDAYICQAQKMRSDAMGEILAAGWKSCVQFIKSFARHPAHKNGVTGGPTASAHS